jgi:hypothetical protein
VFERSARVPECVGANKKMHTEKDVKPVRDDARAASTVNNERDRVDFRVRFSCHDGHRAPILNAAATREILILSRALLRAKCLTERQNITKRRRRTNDERGDECQAGMTRMRLVLRRKQATRNMERLSVRISTIFVCRVSSCPFRVIYGSTLI